MARLVKKNIAGFDVDFSNVKTWETHKAKNGKAVEFPILDTVDGLDKGFMLECVNAHVKRAYVNTLIENKAIEPKTLAGKRNRKYKEVSAEKQAQIDKILGLA